MAAISTIEELSSVEDSAWPDLINRINGSLVNAKVLPVNEQQRGQALFRLQVTAASTLGALAFNCGGLLIDHGWLRVLGGGTPELPSLADTNDLHDPTADMPAPPFLIVAFDVLGGTFAINGGGLPAGRGDVCYFGADTLRRQSLEKGYTAFISWVLGGGLTRFYDELRWPGWEAEVGHLAANIGMSVYPFLFTAEGHDISRARRAPVPMAEILTLHRDLVRQIDQLPDGATISVQIKN